MKSDHRNGNVVPQEERARWVKGYRESGVGLKDFAAEHGLKAGQLHYWVYAPGRVPVRGAVAPVFWEVRLEGNVAAWARWAAEVALPGGLVVRLSEGTELGWAGALVGALTRPCSR